MAAQPTPFSEWGSLDITRRSGVSGRSLISRLVGDETKAESKSQPREEEEEEDDDAGPVALDTAEDDDLKLAWNPPPPPTKKGAPPTGFQSVVEQAKEIASRRGKTAAPSKKTKEQMLAEDDTAEWQVLYPAGSHLNLLYLLVLELSSLEGRSFSKRPEELFRYKGRTVKDLMENMGDARLVINEAGNMIRPNDSNDLLRVFNMFVLGPHPLRIVSALASLRRERMLRDPSSVVITLGLPDLLLRHGDALCQFAMYVLCFSSSVDGIGKEKLSGKKGAFDALNMRLNAVQYFRDL